MYADDAIIVYKAKDPNLLIEKMSHDLIKIQNWLFANRMSLNKSKTNYMIFQNKSFPTSFPNYFVIGNDTYNQVRSSTYLGLIIDDHLSWQNHISTLKKSIWPYAFALKKIRKHINIEAAWMIYHAYINSRLTYMSAIWTGASFKNIKDLRVLQNRIIKTIKCLPILQPTRTIYSSQVLPIDALGNFELLMFIRKIQLHLINCTNIFVTVNDIHSYSTRQTTQTNFYVRTVATSRAQGNPFYKGLILFNLLPEHFKTEMNIKSFKEKIKEFLYDKWLNTLR